MPVKAIVRDFTKLRGCNLCDRTQILACSRIFMPGKIKILLDAIFFALRTDRLASER